MAFTLEDGTGVADANAIITVAFWRAFHTDRGESDVDGSSISDAAVEALIIRATDYMNQRFGTKLLGSRATTTQTLPFLRDGLCIDGVELPDDEIPLGMRQACAIYALVAKDVAALMPNPPIPFDRADSSGSVVSGAGAVVEREEQVGPIRERVRMESVRNAMTRAGLSALVDGWAIPQYPSADLLMEPFLTTRSKVIRQ